MINTHTISTSGIAHAARCFLMFALLMMVDIHVSADDTDFGVESITTRNGLSNNTIRDILQDKMGYMWFCTPNGLNCYDGTMLKKYSSAGMEGQRLTDTRTRRISEDEQGYLWVSSMSDQFSCYDMQGKHFVDLTCGGRYNFKYSNNIHIGEETWLYGGYPGGAIIRLKDGKANVTLLGDKMDLLASHFVNFVRKGVNGVWIGTEKGLYRWDGKDVSCQEKKECYIAYLEDGDRELFLTKRGGVYIVDAKGGKGNMITPTPYLYNIYGAAKWHNLWIVYTERDCFAFDILNEKFCNVPQELRMEHTRRLIRDNKGGTWVSDKDNNLLYIGDKKNLVRRFNLIPKDMLMQSHEFFSVFHGLNDVIWISTIGNGLYAKLIPNLYLPLVNC